MRISFGKRRKGSLAIEAVMIIPLALIIVFLARFVMEGMLTRHEVAVYARGSAINVAYSTVTVAGCTHDSGGFVTGAGVNRTGSANCKTVDAERGLQSESPVFEALRQGASAWTGLADHMDDGSRTEDVVATATGSMSFDNPPFLASAGQNDTEQVFKHPQNDLWADDERWRTGHDQVIWRELQRGPVHDLFPNVFPSGS